MTASRHGYFPCKGAAERFHWLGDADIEGTQESTTEKLAELVAVAAPFTAVGIHCDGVLQVSALDVDPKFDRNQTALMGYSVREADWRYTAWFAFDQVGMAAYHVLTVSPASLTAWLSVPLTLSVVARLV
jgi:hypothetical protein